jgi:HD-GYP domain-containing protein (c-di-GMP phosphodiesterase class II)
MKKIPIDDVEPGDVSAIDLKIHSDDPSVQYRVRIDEGQALTREHLSRLSREGIGYLFVRDKDLDDLDPFIFDKNVQHAEEELVTELRDIRSDVETGANYNITVKRLNKSLTKLIDAIQKTDSMMAFSSLKAHDEYTAKHSVDVAKLALTMVLAHPSTVREKLRSETGASYEYTNKYLERDLGLGALLHDIGKWTIPADILTKPNALDDQEWTAMKQHPRTGKAILDQQEREFRAPVKVAVSQHHEEYDGGGYPLGHAQNDIHLYGRITAICDVYAALTSDRPYRLQKTPNRAREIMDSMQTPKGERHFDPDLLDMFKETIPPFPVGQSVVLSNGKRGVVSELGDDQYKPMVRILYEGNNRIDDPYEIQANTESGPQIVN